MAFPIGSGDVIRAACRLRDGYGSDIMNVYHFVYTGSATDSAEVGTPLRQALDDMYDHIQPAIPSDTSFIDIDLSNASSGLIEASQPWPVQTVGGGTGDQMPSKDTALCVGRTNFPHVTARKFLGPFIEADNSDGVWASGLVSALTDFLADYLADIAVTTVGNLSPAVGRYVAGVLTGHTPINGGYTSNGIYSQRRRRPGVGA